MNKPDIDEKVVTGMTEQLITKIQTAITEMGITASIQKKFQVRNDGNYYKSSKLQK